MIPEEFGGLTSLESLSLGYNKLAGSIPAALGKLLYLERLDLHSNELTGGCTVRTRQAELSRDVDY